MKIMREKPLQNPYYFGTQPEYTAITNPAFDFNMKVILYMAISANGMIAKSDDDTSWISEVEWNSYSKTVRDAGALIVGRKTYQILSKQSGFAEIQDLQMVVLSSNDFSTAMPNHQVVSSPKEALEKLKDFETVIVAGGGILNAPFLEQQLVDEIILDIEPILLGKGIKLFEGGDFEAHLELMGTKELSPHEIQLHYKVVK